jgi:uncharacterized membrane protein (UPF0127 family)
MRALFPMALAALLIACTAAPAARDYPPPQQAPGTPAPLDWSHGTAEVVTATGSHRFDIEIADTEDERNRGLMYRTYMAPDAGMLFVYDREQSVAFWMKNTVLPLDLVFIRADGTVFDVALGAVPYSLDSIPSGGPVLAVLEVNAGIANQIGLRRGDVVRAEAFGNAP